MSPLLLLLLLRVSLRVFGSRGRSGDGGNVKGRRGGVGEEVLQDWETVG